MKDKIFLHKAVFYFYIRTIILIIYLILTSCSTSKYSAKKYEYDRKDKRCPTYGFNRVENKYHYFDAPRLYQQTDSYKYGPWNDNHLKWKNK